MIRIVITCILSICLSFSSFSQQREIEQIPAKKLKAMGKASLQMGDTYSAIDYFEAYCQKKEDYEVMYLLADCYRLARNYPQAKKWFEKAYKAKPSKNVLALYYFACMLKTEQKYEEAGRQFKAFRKQYDGSKSDIDFKRLAAYQIIACDTAKQMIDSAVMVEIHHLHGSVNKASIEFAPQYINDTTLLYASLRTDTAVYSVFDGENSHVPIRQFYTARLQNYEWKYLAEWNNATLNPDKQNMGNGVFSVDGKRFYFTRCEQNWKFQTICKLYVSNKQGSKWGEPQLLPEIINAKNVTNTQPALGTESKNGDEVLYFVSNRPGGKGGYDIWFTIYNPRKKLWREPKNCGNKINSAGDELTPFYDNKNRTLYFSSTGWPGLGELDIFSCIGELGKFNPAENVGYPINSPYDDLYYVLHVDGKKGFYTSNRPGTVSYSHPTCCDDLFSFNYTGLIVLAATGKVYEIYNKKIQDILKSQVESNEKSPVDTTEKKYIEGSVVTLYLHDKQNKERTFLLKDTTNKQGEYFFDLKVNKDYILEFQSNKIPPTTVEFTTRGVTMSDTLELNDVGVEYLSNKDPFIIKNIYYDFDKYKLRTESQKVIDSTLLVILREAPDIIIELSSHTDSKGDDEYNMELSQKRAESVVNYLIKKGIDKNRLVAKGYGETRPIAPNENQDGTDNPEGRQKNRRTEFRIIGNLSQYSEIIYEE